MQEPQAQPTSRRRNSEQKRGAQAWQEYSSHQGDGQSEYDEKA